MGRGQGRGSVVGRGALGRGAKNKVMLVQLFIKTLLLVPPQDVAENDSQSGSDGKLCHSVLAEFLCPQVGHKN